LEFNVPFQHKYGYIRDEGRDGQKKKIGKANEKMKKGKVKKSKR